jgi:hypothetical protein
MPEIIDLSTLLRDEDPGDDRKIDRSGRPKPQDVRVQLNSGVVIRCEVRYDGIDKSDMTRRFLVIAEIDWENYHPKAIIIGEMPNDSGLYFRVPGLPDDVCEQVAAGLQVHTEKFIKVV